MNPPPARPDIEFAKPAPDCLRAAHDYLNRGWSALPLCPADHADIEAEHKLICATPGETPLWPWRAYQERLPSERVLSIYWNRNPLANVGIALGPVSGLLAVIVQSPDGESTRRRLAETLPQTLELAGPDGTRRLLYALPAGAALPGGSIRIADSEDVAVCLSTGSCIPLPPSQHPCGGTYAWLPGCAPCEREAAPVPPWLVERLLSQDNSATLMPAAPEQDKSAGGAISAGPSPADPDARPNVPEKHEPVKERGLQAVNPGPVPHVIFLNRVQPCPATWLWPGWIPLGKLTVLDGDPGLGKSTLLLDRLPHSGRPAPLPPSLRLRGGSLVHSGQSP
jgi:Bifunctional DNA primase/polymerase, N-terminal/AAA domain